MVKSFDFVNQGIRKCLPPMMFVTIKALKKLGGSARIQEIDEKIVELENISSEEQEIMMPTKKNIPKLNYYLAWARTYLGKIGAIENSSRGVWSLTHTGWKVSSIEECKKFYDLVQKEMIKKTSLKVEKSYSKFEEDFESEASDQEINWKSELIDALLDMEPKAFERLCQRLLRESGFEKVNVTGKSGDGGIDGGGILKLNSIISIAVYFQCKRWRNSVSSSVIRDFRGALHGRADKGLLITTGSFTKAAHSESKREGTILIDLIDGDKLCDLLKELDIGVEVEKIDKVTVNKEWFQKF